MDFQFFNKVKIVVFQSKTKQQSSEVKIRNLRKRQEKHWALNPEHYKWGPPIKFFHYIHKNAAFLN